VNFAREGTVFIGTAAVLFAAALATALVRRSWPLWLLAFVLALLTLWVAYFFRDPERQGDRGERLVVSPADGRVVLITDLQEPGYMQGPTRRISIFMNVFDVHVNRYPVAGTVRYVHYNPGKFLNAATEKSSLENEQRSVGIEMNAGHRRILVRQIAGLIARRIVTYSREGDVVAQGARMGIIRFGSRVDVYLPPDAQLRVAIGQRATAGVTVLAELAP
jgi:phosphatidylserine decarboxylase